MPDYVRVRDTSGHEITVRADRVAEGVEVIDKPALGRDGRPAPVKYRTNLGTALPGSKQARKAAKKTTPAPPASGETSGQLADTEKE